MPLLSGRERRQAPRDGEERQSGSENRPLPLFPTRLTAGVPEANLQGGAGDAAVVRGGAMICPNCRHENVAAAKFCLECGTKLRAICPHCSAELPPTAKFCHECGAALAAPAAPAEPPS